MASGSSSTATDRTVVTVWQRVPRAVSSVSPLIGELMTESRYLLAWPTVAAWGPVAALAAGVLAGLLHPGPLYSSSVVVVCVVVIVAGAGPTAGTWFAFGYLPADLLVRRGSAEFGSSVSLPGLAVADLVLLVLLVLWAIAVPRLTAQTMFWLRTAVADGADSGHASDQGPTAHRRHPQLISTSTTLHAAVAATVYAILVWSWLQAVPVLIRPAFTWAGSFPAASDVEPAQLHVAPIVALGAVAAGLCAAAEHIARLRPHRLVPDAAAHRRASRDRPLWVSVTVRAALGLLICAGLLGTLIDTVTLGTLLLVGLAAQEMAGRSLRWHGVLEHAPVLLRLAAVVFGTMTLGPVVTARFTFTDDGFLPVILTTAVGLFLAAVLLPVAELTERLRGERR